LAQALLGLFYLGLPGSMQIPFHSYVPTVLRPSVLQNDGRRLNTPVQLRKRLCLSNTIIARTKKT
jgi:hypothetical protein